MKTALYIPMLYVLLILSQLSCSAQKLPSNNNLQSAESSAYDAMEWRLVGPFRGGRSCAVSGVAGKPNLFYFGAAGGGIWKTKNGGRNWENISDGFFGGSIGAIAISPSDHNVMYAGGGEKTVRGNVSHGYGVWRSEDAGKTWTSKGLSNSRHISRIRIHPNDPNIVYAAVMGDLYKSSNKRGVYRSKDGGTSWQKILFANADAGAVDLLIDPNNPRVLYASTWRVRRRPWDFSSGGEGSGLWKSTDGGDNWEALDDRPGMPKGPLGISGFAVSPVNSERVWAIVEAAEGGVFRSDDAGKTWKRLNKERSLRQRAWYYSRIYADPADEDIVYVLNVRYHKSKDGGKTFKAAAAPHGDHHDLWIAPENPARMIIGDDGGAQITYDGGQTWSTYHNQPTAQFYRVTTDNHFPFRIYAAQQDNSTIRIPHRTSGRSIGDKDWESTAGCECGHIAIDPNDNDIVYGGCYDGLLQRKDHRNDQTRSINVWPDNPMGHGAEGMKYRFQWNFPILFSPHDSKKLYSASNHLHLSTDEGQSWKTISPDLTRNDSTKLGPSGGPITKDNTSVEYYCTIFAVAESPLKKGVIWAGSDDGLIHITQDGGSNWTKVQPAGLPDWIQINSIEADPFEAGGAYVAATMYKHGDFRPYLYHTTDYGKSWTKITNGIDPAHFTRVIRADSKRKGLLYAGTESGMYVSFDNGRNWKSFQLNLPIVPITDLALKDQYLIAATQGRSLWIIDDLGPLHQKAEQHLSKALHLYQPSPSYRISGSQNKKVKNAGINHPGGVKVYYYLKDTTAKVVALHFMEQNGDTIQSFSTKSKEKQYRLKVEKGANSFLWDMRYPKAKKFDGMILWWGSMNGPRAIPGDYKLVLQTDSIQEETSFRIEGDPRIQQSATDYQKQFDFAIKVNQKISEAHETIIDIRDIKAQLSTYSKRLKRDSSKKALVDQAMRIDSSLSVIEKALYQTKNKSRQDPLNFPIRLTNKLAHLNSLTDGNAPPTKQAEEVRRELTAAIDQELAAFQEIVKKELPAFNQLVRRMEVDAIILDKD